MQAIITAKLETSTHDGYCSGEENEYKVKINTYTVNLSEKYKNLTRGKLTDIDEYVDDLIELLPIPNVEGDSYYCDISPLSKLNNLGAHAYRYTVISIEII
jgi:hypothetical protein